MEKQKITFTDTVDRDIIGFAVEKGWMCIQIFYMRQGKMIERQTTSFPYYGEENEDFMTYVSQFYYDKQNALPKEILLPEQSDTELLSDWLGIKVHAPKRSKKRELVQLASENARIALQEKFALMSKDDARTVQAVHNLGHILGIGVPHRIEAFDNSNIQGTEPVSAMIVFTDGRPDKKEYRKFKIKTVEGPDDYGSMREVIRRRYSRLLKENQPMPDLIVMDIQLPEISGLEITDRLKKDPALKAIPVVAVTAFAMRGDEQKILAAGCDAYLSKLISVTTFLETIRKFIG